MSILGIYILVLIGADVHRDFRDIKSEMRHSFRYVIFIRQTQWGHIGVSGKADDLI